jgi:L-asparaginase II
MTSPAADPMLVEVTRGDLVESRHRGACAVVDARGKVVLAIGDIAQPVYGRSALKPLQALPLIESGAAEHFGLGDREIALACGSHRGEAVHVAAVAAWLARIGMTAEALDCGAHPPLDGAAAQELVRRGEAPSALHNNCSGKHAGFLTTARHRGEPVRGYIAAEHPVQQRVLAALAAMTGVDLAAAARGIDGCGIPVVALPLVAIARAMARLADPADLPAERAAAAGRILAAMTAEPLMIAGSGSFTSTLMASAGAQLCLKPGAEGVFCAALPEQGLGVALKIADGAGRAAEVAIGAVLVRLGILDESRAAHLAPLLRPTLRNVAGRAIGEIRPV